MTDHVNDPVTYTVVVQHWQDGEVVTTVTDVGSSQSDRQAIAYALRKAADQVEFDKPMPLDRLS